jgi:hypothetical protein
VIDAPLWPLVEPGQFLLLVVVYPALEEIVFRAGLQEWMRRTRLGGRRLGVVSAANLVTSLIFAAMHVAYRGTWLGSLVLAPSLIFGYFWDKSRSLAPCISLHVFYNAGYFWLFRP